MPYRSTLISIALMITVAIAILYLFQERVAGSWLKLAIHPDIQTTLTATAEDQKTLAKLDTEQAETYKARFEKIQSLRNHLFILETHGRDVVRRYQFFLLLILIFIVAATLVLQYLTQRRVTARVNQLRQPLSALAAGQGALDIPQSSNDVIGRISAMIAQTGRVMNDQRERLRYLEHLSGWQEASRRHAHEIRTPLTAARLETERLEELVAGGQAETEVAIRNGAISILEELDRIKRFTKEFTAFARVRKPQPEPLDLQVFLSQFCLLFAKAWSNLTVEFLTPSQKLPLAQIDGEMIRQVLVNLGNNSSYAINDKGGTFTLGLEQRGDFLVITAEDNGPGIPGLMVDRLFEPYATTSNIGEGMGLGLAISRKILLDHHGELLLAKTGPNGTHFHLMIPITTKENTLSN